MKFIPVTIFPEIFDGFFKYGVSGKAINSKVVEVSCQNLRDFSDDEQKTVDSRPYGGGPGMVLQAKPLKKAVEAVTKKNINKKINIVYFSPHGKQIDQAMIESIVKDRTSVDTHCLICGRYEGVDERFIETYVDNVLSVGDLILSGGELAAMIFMDSIIRRLPGVLGNEDSALNDSFMKGMLQYPQYGRPEVFDSLRVPEVLLNGDHGAISKWRRRKAIEKTAKYRPDLLERCLRLGEVSFEEVRVVIEKNKK